LNFFYLLFSIIKRHQNSIFLMSLSYPLLLEVLATIDDFSENGGFTLAFFSASKETRKILKNKKVKLHLNIKKWHSMQNETRVVKLQTILSQLKKLKDSGLIVSDLNMSCCYFGSLGVKKLNKVINNENISCYKLLVLSCNNIGITGAKTIAKLIGKMKNLEELDLSGNCFGNKGATHLAEGLKLCTSLQKLGLGRNMIHALGIKEIAGALAGCSQLQPQPQPQPQLKCLELVRNEFGDVGATYIAEAIKNNKLELTSLDIARNNIGELGMENIANALGQCSMFTSLDISCNCVCNNIFEKIGGVLTILNIEYCNIGEYGTHRLGVLPESLTCLNLKGNDIDANGATHLADGLKKCKGLITLDLGDNAIGPEGATSIAEVLTQCTSITNLSLQGNDIGENGAMYLATELVFSERLAFEDLNLRSNDIGSFGLQMIVCVLQRCPNLKKLDLYYNSIGTTGAESLADILPKCTSLTELNLSINEIGPEGAERLAAVLPQCIVLEHLGLYYNNIGDEGAFSLADVLPRCAALTSLDVSDNYIGPDGTERLTAASNTQLCTHIELIL
jgi:Ran GTPase-activating protein (RanGAP) involved in mRNA processing and transport